MTLALRYTVQSDVGLLREGNEDSAYAGPHLLAIADGMGGHAAGEVASAVAISTVAPLDTDMTGVDMLQVLADAIAEANAELRQVTLTDPSTEGMGTTLTALLWSGEEEFALCHIGDSRAYLLRDGVFHRISHDHTLVQSLVDEGRLTPEAAATHPQRSLVMRALQSSVPAEPDLAMIKAKAGDRYLLCSDGLTDVVTDETVGKTLGEISDLDEAVAQLIDLAIRGGGPDNITCVLADVIDTDSGQEPSADSIIVGALLGDDEQDAEPVRTDSPAARARLLTLGSRTGEATGATAGSDGAQAGPGTPGTGAPTAAGTTASAGAAADGTAADGSESGMAGHAVLADGAAEDEDDEDDEDALSPPGRRRWPVVSTTLVILLAVVCGGGYLFWRFTQSEYFVGTADGRVVVFRGVNDAVGGVRLSSMVQKTDIPINGVPTGEAGQIKATIPAGTLAQAHQIVSRIRRDYTCASVQADIRVWAAQQPKPAPAKSTAGVGKTSATRMNSHHHASGSGGGSGSKTGSRTGSKSGSGKTSKPKPSPSPSPSPKPSGKPKPVLPRYCPAYPGVPG